MPQGHPLCEAAEASTIPERARELSRLHAGLRSDSVAKVSAFKICRSSRAYGLRATANHQGVQGTAAAAKKFPFLCKQSLSAASRVQLSCI